MDRFVVRRPKPSADDSTAEMRTISDRLGFSFDAVMRACGTDDAQRFLELFRQLHGRKREESNVVASSSASDIDGAPPTIDFRLCDDDIERQLQAVAREILDRRRAREKRRHDEEMRERRKKAAHGSMTRSSAIDAGSRKLLSLQFPQHIAQINGDWRNSDEFVYIGRTMEQGDEQWEATEWSLPMHVRIDQRTNSQRPLRDMLEQYKLWLDSTECTLDFRELAGKRLVCSCPAEYRPNTYCHGPILLQRARAAAAAAAEE